MRFLCVCAMEGSVQEALLQALYNGLSVTGSGWMSEPRTSLDLRSSAPSSLSQLLRQYSGLENLLDLLLDGTNLGGSPASLTAVVQAAVNGRLPSLRLLSLSGTGIDALPPALALRSLVVLKLECNALSKLPEALCSRFSSLEELWLGCNQLRSLPGSIGALRHLRELWADDNLLAILPPSIGSLSNLEALSLASNCLGTRRVVTTTAVNADDGDSSREQHCCFPPSFCQLDGLRRLWIRDNQLQHVPWPIQHLPLLEELDVRANPLRGLPSRLGTLNLRTLRLDAFGGVGFDAGASSLAVLQLLSRLHHCHARRGVTLSTHVTEDGYVSCAVRCNRPVAAQPQVNWGLLRGAQDVPSEGGRTVVSAAGPVSPLAAGAVDDDTIGVAPSVREAQEPEPSHAPSSWHPPSEVWLSIYDLADINAYLHSVGIGIYHTGECPGAGASCLSSMPSNTMLCAARSCCASSLPFTAFGPSRPCDNSQPPRAQVSTSSCPTVSTISRSSPTRSRRYSRASTLSLASSPRRKATAPIGSLL